MASRRSPPAGVAPPSAATKAGAAARAAAGPAAAPPPTAASARAPSVTAPAAPWFSNPSAVVKPVEEGEAQPHALDRMFRPRTVAVIGGSDDVASIGGAVLHNLVRGGFDGRIDVVNPGHRRVRDRPSVASARELAEPPDLAVVATPAHTWSEVLDDLGRIGAKSAVILSPGSDHRGAAGSTTKSVESRLAEQARRYGIRLIGPGSLGLARPADRLDATFGRSLPPAGPLALVTRSGASLAALLDLAEGSGVGVSTAVATGDGSDIGLGDVLDFLTFDQATRSIALMVESIGDTRTFVSALRAAARTKPVVVLHAGSRLACESERAAFAAMLARCGAVAVDSFGAMFSAVESLSSTPLPRGERLGVVANGRGLGLLAADACAAHRVSLASPAGLPNPYDVGEAATAGQFAEAMAAMAASSDVDAVLALFSPTRLAGAEETARALTATPRRVPTLYALLGLADAALGRQLLNAAGHVVFESPDAAVRGISVLAEYQRNQRQLLEAPRQEPQTRPIDESTIDALLAAAARHGRPVLDDTTTDELLAACGIASAGTLLTADLDEAAAWARRHGYPIVLGVVPAEPVAVIDERGDIRSERELRGAAAALRGRWLETWPQATFTGFRVRRMFDSRDALPLRLTIETEPTFGPVLRFGAGGRAALLAPGLSTGLPPLSRPLAEAMVAAAPVASLLAGSASADATRDAVIDTLLAIATLAVRYPAIRSLQIDPLHADDRGVTAIETVITIDPALPRRDSRHGHLAIHPYPVDVEKHVTLKDGRPVFIRPIRPDDAAMGVAFFEALSAQSRHWRFLHPIKMLTPQMIARFTQVDYERDMALVALPEAGEADAPSQIVGVARYVREPDAGRAEFAIVVADAWQATGLASAMIDQLIAHARLMGLRRLVGHVHGQNLRMLAFMRRHGFRIDSSTLEPSLLLATMHLDQGSPAAVAT